MKGIVLLVGGFEDDEAADAIVNSMPGGRFVPRAEPSSSTYGSIVADLMSVLPTDRVYFFLRRGLYGVGRLLLPKRGIVGGAWIKPDGTIGLHLDPSVRLMRAPIDMDEILMRPGNEIASGLRMMGGKNFFQLDPDESNWLEEQFHRRHLSNAAHAYISIPRSPSTRGLSPLALGHPIFSDRLPATASHAFSSENMLHASVLERLRDPSFARPSQASKPLCLISLHHEYPASPAKQAKYVDRIDAVRVFGSELYATRGTAAFYDCWEMKKDELAELEFERAVAQVMKYVDFIASSRLAGDYSRVSMNIVASAFPSQDVRRRVLSEYAERRFQLGVRAQARACRWSEVRCFEYSWSSGQLRLKAAR